MILHVYGSKDFFTLERLSYKYFLIFSKKLKIKSNAVADACSQPPATQQKNSTSPYAFMNLNNSIIKVKIKKYKMAIFRPKPSQF
jgi:hypothetical protein